MEKMFRIVSGNGRKDDYPCSFKWEQEEDSDYNTYSNRFFAKYRDVYICLNVDIREIRRFTMMIRLDDICLMEETDQSIFPLECQAKKIIDSLYEKFKTVKE
jgi:hypothetical protein